MLAFFEDGMSDLARRDAFRAKRGSKLGQAHGSRSRFARITCLCSTMTVGVFSTSCSRRLWSCESPWTWGVASRA